MTKLNNGKLRHGVTMTNKKVTIDQAAAQYGVHRRTLERRLRDGLLNRYRCKGTKRVFLDQDELNALFTPQLDS